MGGGGGVTGAVVGGVTGFVTGGPVGAVVGAGAGYYEGKQYDKAKKAQKQQQQFQQSIINEQKKNALEARKEQINQMRAQIGSGGYTTRATPEKGIVGTLKEDTLG